MPSFDRVLQRSPVLFASSLVVSPWCLTFCRPSLPPRLTHQTPPTGQPVSSINQSITPDALAAHPTVQHPPPTDDEAANIPRSTAQDGAQYRLHISQIVSTTGTQSGTFRVFWVKPFETSRRRSPARTRRSLNQAQPGEPLRPRPSTTRSSCTIITASCRRRQHRPLHPGPRGKTAASAAPVPCL